VTNTAQRRGRGSGKGLSDHVPLVIDVDL